MRWAPFVVTLLLGLSTGLRAQVQSFGEAYAFEERQPRTELERTIDRLLPSIVKVHGASGLSTIRAYASGVIVSAEGHILTLDLVMIQPGQTRVVLYDGSVHQAELLPSHDKLGLRLLKIDPEGLAQPLTPLWPRKTGDLRNGTFAISLGNAFRLAEFSEKVSATFGMVVGQTRTGLRYRLADVDYDGELILTDAPNNPGHFGGGLFTLEGEWIGLNTRIVESTETNSVISAAIPAPDLVPYLERWVLGKRGAEPVGEEKPVAVFHGIVLFDMGGRRSPPAYVDRVLPGSPGAKIGLKPDDMIVRLGRQAIRTCQEFRDALKKYRPGQEVEITYKRGDEIKRDTLVLEEAR